MERNTRRARIRNWKEAVTNRDHCWAWAEPDQGCSDPNDDENNTVLLYHRVVFAVPKKIGTCYWLIDEVIYPWLMWKHEKCNFLAVCSILNNVWLKYGSYEPYLVHVELGPKCQIQWYCIYMGKWKECRKIGGPKNINLVVNYKPILLSGRWNEEWYRK